MNCNDFNADLIPVREAIPEELIEQIKGIDKCGHCASCLYTYIMLAPQFSNEELIQLFGADLLESPELIPVFNEIAGLVSNPYPNRSRIARVNKALRVISLQKDKEYKTLIKHYINECIKQYEGDMIEEYFNMSP